MPLSDPIFIQCRKVGAQGGERKRTLRLSANGALSMTLAESGGALSIGFVMDSSLVTHADLAGRAWADAGHTKAAGVTDADVAGLAGWQSDGTPVTVDPTSLGPVPDSTSFKPQDESIANQTQLQLDDHLSLLLPVGNYALDGLILYDGPAPSGIKLGFTDPAGLTATWTTDFNFNGAQVWTGTQNMVGNTYGVGSKRALHVRGNILVTSQATLQLQWAQNTQDGENLTVRTGSWLRASPL